MAKTTKKKNRKLRRQIRKTVGALFMASAVAVAAIPVQDVSANPTDMSEKVIKVAVISDHPTEGNEPAKTTNKNYKSSIPYAQERTDKLEKIVYTSGDGLFQFVYIRPTVSNPNKVAMILGYNSEQNLPDSSLTIPDQLEAYKKYSDNVTREGYCLVSKLDEFLHYAVMEHKKDNGYYLYDVVNYENPDTGLIEAKQVHENETYLKEDGTRVFRVPNGTDENGQTIYKDYDLEPVKEPAYYPCYYNTQSTWGDMKDEELYYKDDKGNYIQAGDATDHWKIKADVAYIGAETIKDDGNGGWVLDDYIEKPEEGVFAGSTNMTNLTIGQNMLGISDFAFYNCGTLSSINLANGLATIGNGAFAECRNLQNFNIAPNALIKAIGKDAFYNCRSLKSFTVPIGIEALGDNCFENCTGLESINFLGDGSNQMYLHVLGNHLFRGCSSLAQVEFPETYTENDLDIDMFQGCTSLQRIIIHNDDINFNDKHSKDDTNYPNCKYTWENFREELPDSFYFQGPLNSSIRDTANNNSVTYKYPDQEIYEKIEKAHSVDDTDPNGKSAQVIYRVNDTGDLVYFGKLQGSKDPDILEIPEVIGAFSINRIAEGSFNNNCYLKKITIPASVTEIGANAFKGCHSLRSVEFTDASTITKIGADAFKTQDAVCADADKLYPATGAEKPELYFVGAMLNGNNEDTEPFKYAMNGSSKISHGNSPNIWITCQSGWPTNLEVQYNEGEAQLVGYPRYDQLGDDWVNALPYVTAGSSEASEYETMVSHVKAYISNPKETSLTPEEQMLLSSVQNVVIPASVDSIRPGLFSGVNSEGEKVDKDGEVVDTGDGIGPDTMVRSVLINGVDELDSYTFKGCEGLTQADVIGSSYIDDYAFEDCNNLSTVTLGTNLKDTGKRPFKGCESVTGINCLAPSDFTYSNGILFRQTGNGLEIVECLENRGKVGGTGSYNVGPDELSGVSSIKEEAFEDCADIAQMDMSKTTVNTIPKSCFKGMELNSITLPSSLKAIETEAFQDRGSKRMVVYFKGDPIRIEEDAFNNNDAKDREDPKQNLVIFQCQEGSNADFYATVYPYINSSDDEVYQEWTVIFYNLPDYPSMSNPVMLDKQTVRSGEDAVPPADPTCNDPNLNFTGWSEYTNIQKDTDVYAIYGSPEYTVTFIDGYTGDTLKTEKVKYGGTATPPAEDEIPQHPGQMFMGWDKPYYDIKADTTIIGRYVDGSGDVNRHTVSFYITDDAKEAWWTTYASDGEVIMAPMPPERAGYTFVKWLWAPAASATGVKQDTSVYAQWTVGSNPSNPGNPNASPGNNGGNSGNNNKDDNDKKNSSASPSASPTASPSVTKYTVSVSGGSGSGSYAAGDIVAVNAYFMGTGQNFDKWTTSTAGVGFANPNASSTTFTMPAANVAITATYKTGNGTAATGGGSTAGGGSGAAPANTGSGTTVQVSKPGISNTGLAGATVSGATDNFIVKVTEQQAATDAAVAALQARYGSLDRIKYFPMDISLYDSTGRTKIADTSGISVNITLPLPDDQVQYAGNNRIAAVTNGSLEDLNAKFTTVDGVPCINFTASHFSPYVIYVDTANLTAGTIDSTPKTGDPIHPKWFLAIGMACISLILFFKKDKAVVRPGRA